ncbi:hypothetical protein JAAARDRAFT_206005 [Jaapia argillacea MUCL 33604]|uniref:F-box domain-containing protein n=1 Tax=Jaapia argillacea MUCL 33604 TaxID=933084 RepID=A0A067PWE1_9AGAM|nr:hypothetical protein JAAARDRAFT_206005 [Jaapia argillacea MUCL 33604]
MPPSEDGKRPLPEALLRVLRTGRTPCVEDAASVKDLLGDQLEDPTVFEAYQSLFAPIRRLPPEVLSSIFLWATYLRGMKNRLVFTHVCHSWRLDALDTPRLWSYIFVDPTTAAIPSTDLVEAHLHRSNSHSLFISITAAGESYEAYISSLLPLLSQYSNRWHAVMLNFPIPLLRHLAPQGSATLKRLKRFHVVDTILGDSSDVVQALSFLADAPMLADFQFVTVKRVAGMFKLPWAQMTRLHLIGLAISPSQCFDILRQCIPLVDFRISVLEDSPFHPSSLGHAVLPHLTTLGISFSAPFWELMGSITLPKLRCLYISHIGDTRVTWPEPHFSIFTHRSAVHLERITFSNISVPSDEMIRAFRNMPALLHCEIPCPSDSIDPLLRSMTCSGQNNQQDYVCPKLESLTIGGVTFSCDALVAMVESRYPMGVARELNTEGRVGGWPQRSDIRLRKLQIGARGSIADEIRRRLARCCGWGLAIST